MSGASHICSVHVRARTWYRSSDPSGASASPRLHLESSDWIGIGIVALKDGAHRAFWSWSERSNRRLDSKSKFKSAETSILIINRIPNVFRVVS